jgi:hypothetical protein
VRGVVTPAKNLIFAANGPKPELVLRDAVNNDIEITRNGEYCLVYDRPIPADGLSFQDPDRLVARAPGLPEDDVSVQRGRSWTCTTVCEPP